VSDWFSVPFHAQLEDLTQMLNVGSQDNPAQDSRSFDFRHMTNALPQYNEQNFQARRPTAPYGAPQSPSLANPANMQYMQQMPQYVSQRHDPMALAKAQQHQFLPPQYGVQQGQYPSNHRQQPSQLQTPPPFAHIDPYAYGVQQPGYSPVDLRFPQPGFPASFGMPGAYTEMGTSYATK